MPRANFTHADKFFNYIRSQTHCSVTAYVTTKGVTISPSCAQPSEKEIIDFVFEHGKGNAIYNIIVIYNPTNNVVYVKYINHKPFPIYKHIFALYVFQNVTAHYVAPPYITPLQFTTPPTTVCIYNIEPTPQIQISLQPSPHIWFRCYNNIQSRMNI